MEIALTAAQAIIGFKRDAAHHIKAIGGQIAETSGQRAAVFVAITVLRHVAKHRGFKALVVAPQNEVDHATDSIGAVNGRRAVFENLDAINCRHRDRI